MEVVVGVLTVSLGVRARPPGVREGLKDMERFPDTDAAAGITSFWTGGRGESSWRGTHRKVINIQNNVSQAHTNTNILTCLG